LGEFVGQVDTEAVDDRDNDECDERGEQAIFNGSGAGFISQELRKIRFNFASFRVARQVPDANQCPSVT